MFLFSDSSGVSGRHYMILQYVLIFASVGVFCIISVCLFVLNS